MRPKPFAILFVILAVANGFLYFHLQKRNRLLEETMSVYLKDRPLMQHIERAAARHKSFLAHPTSGASIREAELHFSNALRLIGDVVCMDSTLTTKEFFSTPTGLEESVQTLIWESQLQFSKSITNYLQTDFKKFNDFMTNTLSSKRNELKRISEDMSKAGVGERKEFLFDIVLYDTIQQFSLIGVRNKTGVQWNEYFVLAQKYLEKMEYFKNSPNVLQLRDELSTFNDVFVSEGKIKVYSKTYDLSHITPAELRSVYKHILLMKNKIGDDLVGDKL